MGGQIAPIAIEGDKLPWKKAQKNGKNNIASEIKNNNIPYFNASCTRTVWWPSCVDSLNKFIDQAQIAAIKNDIKVNIDRLYDIEYNPPIA